MFNTAKNFRRGTGLQAAEAEEKQIAERVEAEAASRFLAAYPPSKPVSSAEANLPSTTSAPPEEREAAESPQGGLRVYPSVPYYGLLSSLVVCVDIAAQCGPAGVGEGEGPRRMNPWRMEREVPAMESALAEAVRRQGSSYLLSNCGCDHQARRGGDGSSGTSGGTPLTYGAYINALTALFREFHRRRQKGQSHPPQHPPQHHTAHVRLSGHPRWRDLSALLAFEENRLVLFLSSSSRATQRYLQQRTAELTQPTTWVAGAALANEPGRLALAEPNPLLAAWNAFLNLPLTTRVDPAALGEGPSQAASLEVLSAASQLLDGFCVSIVSSLPFPGAAQHTPLVRLVEVSPILASTGAAAPPVALAHGKQQQQVLAGRQFTWTISLPHELLGSRAAALNDGRTPTPAPSSATALLVPNLLSCVVACLVDRCHLDSFAITTSVAGVGAGAGVEEPSPSLSTTTAEAGGGAPDGGVRGLTYVGVGGIGTANGATTQRGPSSQSWGAFSRLSSMSWLTDGDRRAAGLMALEEDGEESPVECEFRLDGLRYQRRVGASARKRGRSAEGEDACACVRSSCITERERRAATAAAAAAMAHALDESSVCTVRPAEWGPSFRVLFTVSKAVDVPSDDDDEADGNEPV